LYIKGLRSRQIAMAFTGSFLGAGFVSGQELTQFFAVFGSWGVLGMFFAVLMLFVLGCLVMKIAKRTGFTEFDKIIVEKEIPWLRAVSEYILEGIKARTMFATHYHELTDLSDKYSQVVNLSVSVYESEETVVFLKKVLPGKADKSYGIQVAKLAGLPQPVIERAREILLSLEKSPVMPAAPVLSQPSLFAPQHPILSELEEMDLNGITPLEAINLLFKWKHILS
jgi:hypothetical protein